MASLVLRNRFTKDDTKTPDRPNAEANSFDFVIISTNGLCKDSTVCFVAVRKNSKEKTIS
jgi:hypothetical protein